MNLGKVTVEATNLLCPFILDLQVFYNLSAVCNSRANGNNSDTGTLAKLIEIMECSKNFNKHKKKYHRRKLYLK